MWPFPTTGAFVACGVFSLEPVQVVTGPVGFPEGPLYRLAFQDCPVPSLFYRCGPSLWGVVVAGDFPSTGRPYCPEGFSDTQVGDVPSLLKTSQLLLPEGYGPVTWWRSVTALAWCPSLKSFAHSVSSPPDWPV